MNIIPLLLLCSLVLVAGSVILFVFSARQGDCHEVERLCLMPLEDDEGSCSDGDETPSSSPSQESNP